MLTRAIIVTDIDMTIVDNSYRRARAQGMMMNDWLLSHLVPTTLRWDTPVPSAVRSLNIFSNFFDIVYLTNRTENMRKETEDFLSRNGYPKGRLLMHPGPRSRRCTTTRRPTWTLTGNSVRTSTMLPVLMFGTASWKRFGLAHRYIYFIHPY